MFHYALYFLALGSIVGLAYALYALYKKHRTLKQSYASLVFAGLRSVDVSLLAKLYALENGGHLASGTAQSILDARIAPAPAKA